MIVICRGGVEEGVRPEVWKYLLGYFQWHHTHEVPYPISRSKRPLLFKGAVSRDFGPLFFSLIEPVWAPDK